MYNNIKKILDKITKHQEATDTILQNIKDCADSELITPKAIAKSSGTNFYNKTNITTFCFYIPNRQGSRQKLLIWIPINESHGVIRYVKKSFNMNQANGLNYIAINNIVPAKEDDLGYLYQIIDENSGEDLAIPDGEYFPAGPEGKIAAIINHHDFMWTDYTHFNETIQQPLHITKVHVGTETSKGTFSALTDALKKGSLRLLNTDTIELFPINEYSSEHNYTVEKNTDGSITMIPRKSKAISGWGYDTNGFLKSLYSNYGTPSELKSFVDYAHSLNKKVCIDLQLNHLGEEGSTVNKFFNFSGKNGTPWGDSINNSDQFIREWILQSVKQFVQNYHFDMIRLDMTPHYNNDDFLWDLGKVMPEYTFGQNNNDLIIKRQITTIAEDDRYEHVIRSQNSNIDFAWDFSVTHMAEDIIINNKKEMLPTFVDMLMDRKDSIIYHISHDEQGNNYAKQLRSPQMVMMMALSRGVPMEFNYNFFHFFTGLKNKNILIKVFAEKSGVYHNFAESDWKYLTEFHNVFHDFKELREFMINFQEDCFLGPNVSENLNKILSNINLKNRFAKLAKKHFKQMEILAQNRQYNKDDQYENLLSDMRAIRSNYPWLAFSNSPEDEYSVEDGIARILRVNPFNIDEQLKVIVNWNSSPKSVRIPITNGKWKIYTDSHHHLKGSIKEVNQELKIAFKPFQAIILERVSKNKDTINWAQALGIFKPVSDLLTMDPKDQLDINEDFFNTNKDIAGKFIYDSTDYYYGFVASRLYIFNNTNIQSLKQIYIREHSGNYKMIKLDQNNLIRESKSQIYIDLLKIDVNGANTFMMYIPLKDETTARIYVPR